MSAPDPGKIQKFREMLHQEWTGDRRPQRLSTSPWRSGRCSQTGRFTNRRAGPGPISPSRDTQ